MPLLIFSSRLHQLMQAEKTSKRKLSNEINVDRKSIRTYLQGECLPRYDTLAAIADYFEVSADFLLGLENDSVCCYKTFCKKEEIPQIFIARLVELMHEKNLSQGKLAKQIKMTQPSVSKWIKGKTMPETFALIDIAKHLNCKVDYLIGREQK